MSTRRKRNLGPLRRVEDWFLDRDHNRRAKLSCGHVVHRQEGELGYGMTRCWRCMRIANGSWKEVTP